MSVHSAATWLRLAALVPLAAVHAACALLSQPPTPPFGICLPLQNFDQDASGWYYRDHAGNRNSGLWRGGAGLGGTGALVLPHGVDVILRDGPLDLPRENVCFLGHSAAGARPVAMIGWLRRGDTAACAGPGCFLTQFPPRPPCSPPRAAPGPGPPVVEATRFDLYQFPSATVQGPQCEVPEGAFIAVRHEGEFVIDSLGVLFGGSADCLATCRAATDCDDASACTTDACVAGRCSNEITCTTGTPIAEIPAASELGLGLLVLLLAAEGVRRLCHQGG